MVTIEVMEKQAAVAEPVGARPRLKTAVVGCGNICGQYFNATKLFPILDVTSCCDVTPGLAEAKAVEFGIARACSFEQILADPEIQIVINLTPPKAHAAINNAIIAAGKHPYAEKPLGVTFEEGKQTIELARQAGVRVGCAPDTFLGGGLQTCRKVIEEGWIGRPLAATAFMVSRGMEQWHPNCDFFYQAGGGPMLDMGPYYVTALVNLLGPVARVSGATGRGFTHRTIGCAPRKGEKVPVGTPTHYAGTLEFASGAIGTIVMSFDVWTGQLPRIEIYGTEGTLSVPDPNGFGGPVSLWRPESGQWRELPLTHNAEVGRGIGAADMATALVTGRPHRASGDLALHVLEVMTSFEKASTQGRHITLETQCQQPQPLPRGLMLGELDD